MKRYVWFPLLILLSLLSSLVSYASNEINFHQLGVKIGMSDNYIQSIEQDKYGFMWFATRDGLNRYDGYHFKVYTTIQQGAYNNSIEWVKEDAGGHIWIKTSVNYCFYDRERDELNNKTDILLHQIGIFDVPKQLFIDDDKNLWCISKDTLYYYTFTDQKLHTQTLTIPLSIADISCRNKECYMLMKNGNIIHIDWMHNSMDKLFRIKTQTSYLPKIYLDFSSRLWIYTPHSYQINCYSLIENKWIDFAAKADFQQEQAMITTIADDGKGNIWMGTDDRGIIIYSSRNRNGKEFKRLFKDNDNVYSLPDNHITYIYKDNRDRIWVGTGKQGVAYAGLNNLIFHNHYCPQLDDISCFHIGTDNKLWFGSDGEGIACYNKNQNRYTYYNTKNGKIPSDLIVCSYPDNKGGVWWGSFGGGAFYFQNNQFFQLKSLIKNEIETPKYIRRITQDGYGNIWFATYSQGLYCLSPSGLLTNYHLNNSALLTNYIADLAYDGNHSLYVATSSGVYHMNTSTHEIKILKQTADGKEIIQDQFANCIYQDSRGLLWIGGRKGVNVYHPRRNQLINLSKPNGVSHPYIRAIIEDQSHNMWLTTDHGITYVEAKEIEKDNFPDLCCHPYYEKDGVADITFNNFSIYCTQKNEVLAGGSGGYVTIYPHDKSFYHVDKRVVFTNLYIGNECVNANQPTRDGIIHLSKNIQLLNKLDIDYSSNSFDIEFSAMDYGNLHKLQYEYKLKESDKWTKLDGNRIYFNKLTPGTYQLEVRIADVPTHEKSTSASLCIEVHPPFWLSHMAYSLYILFLIIMITLILMRMRHKHKLLLLRQKHDLEAVRQHEIDEAKLQFFTNVSHDLRTPLSLIITPLEQLLENNVTQNIHKELKLMHRNALALLDVINQLLDLRRLENGKAQYHPSHGDLSSFIKEICDSFYKYGKEKEITFSLSLQTKHLETDFDKNKMQRIMLNLLSNAFKYNVYHGSVNVIVNRIVKDGVDFACIQVADTGMGIREENKAKVFNRFYQEEHPSSECIGSGIGMHIVKEYVALHHGVICIRDNHPQGTVFEFVFPIRHECKNTMVATSPTDSIPKNKEDVSTRKQSNQALLIVEDNDDFRQFMVDCLQEKFIVFEAEQGEIALKIMAQHDISLVISDIRMPIMNGLELCNKIKGDIRYSHIPVILLTAQMSQEHLLEGLREGADDYITKPFNLTVLLLRIQKLLEWSNRNHQEFGKKDISPADLTISSLDEKLIEQAIAAVDKNMDNTNFSVEDLSMAVSMSRGHLYKKLMMITGKSPIEFIRVLRIKKGKQLLEQSQDNISQIAYQVGLSPKQFAKYFKEEFGCLPSEYIGKKA